MLVKIAQEFNKKFFKALCNRLFETHINHSDTLRRVDSSSERERKHEQSKRDSNKSNIISCEQKK